MSWLDSLQRADSGSLPDTAIRCPDPDRVPTTADELGLPEVMSGDGPLVSVILPTYDDAQYLPAALESVGRQTYQNLEVVIVDSTGVSWVEALANDRHWIRYTYSRPQGLSAARNDGIERANGSYIALLDADDYWHPEKIERQLDAVDDEPSLVYTGFYRVTFEGGQPREVQCWGLEPPSDRPVDDVLNSRVLVFPSTLLFSSDVGSDRPFEESLDAWEDVFFIVEALLDNDLKHVPEPLAVYRNRFDSLSSDQKQMYSSQVQGLELLATRYPELERDVIRSRADAELRLGVCYLKENEKSTARRHIASSLRQFPFDFRAPGLYLATILPVDSRRTVKHLRPFYNAIFES